MQAPLKRWLAAGLAIEGWGANHRESHVSMGGMQLVNFANGFPEAALDAIVGHQEQHKSAAVFSVHI